MSVMTTPDGRYIVVRGRLWRAANPHLSDEDRAEWTASLMRARRAVGVALRNGDDEAERAARRKVNRAKVRLGERGAVWWSDGAADFNRRLVRNSPYREWHQEIERWEAAILSMLEERDPSASICPSEVARQMAPRAWRRHMDDARDAARRLSRRGEVALTQRGKVLDPDSEFRGPVRISRPR